MKRVRPKKSVEANVRRVLPSLLRRYLRRGSRLVRDRAPNEDLHRFRIRTKRLRYVAELYSDLYPGALSGALKQLHKLQSILGELQDQSMVQAWFERRLGQVRSAARQAVYQRMVHRARARQNTLRRQFFRQWEKLDRAQFGKKLRARIRDV